MSREKAVEICKLLGKTIKKIVPKVKEYHLEMMTGPSARKEDLKRKLKNLIKKHNIKKHEIKMPNEE